MDDERIVSSLTLDDDEAESTLRPRCMADYVGQDKIKSNLSFFFSSMVGKSLAVLSFVGIGLGAYSTLAAGYNCIVDPDCKFVNAENGNSFFSKFKEVNFKDAFVYLYLIAIKTIENTYTVKTENEEN